MSVSDRKHPVDKLRDGLDQHGGTEKRETSSDRLTFNRRKSIIRKKIPNQIHM